MLDLQILVKGKPITKYWDQHGNTFVEGRRGSDYVIRLTNNNWHKVKAVVSVDGVNVLTGDQVWEKGYVVLANSYTDIPGWRIDATKASKFIFADLKDGYAQNGGNAGVIGAMVFAEQPQLWLNNQLGIPTTLTTSSWPDNIYIGASGLTYRSTGSTGPSGPIGGGTFTSSAIGSNDYTLCDTAMSVTQNSLATGWGESTTFNTYTDTSKFYDTPSQTTVVYYDSAKGLERRGIKVTGSYTPKAFPNSKYKADFGCPPPKYRRR